MPVSGPQLVSVVMAVHNGAGKLPGTIESILGQDLPDFEFIIVNDGSDDRSQEQIDAYAKMDARIKPLATPNRGLTRSLVLGCATASGRFIARQDVGDVSMPDRLRLQAKALIENRGAVLSVGGVDRVYRGVTAPEPIGCEPDSARLTRRLREELTGIPAHGVAMFATAAYRSCGGYREQFYYSQDSDLWLRLAYAGSAHCVPKVVYQLDMTVGGISSTRQKLQSRFHRLAVEAHKARRSGGDESAFLAQADRLRERAEHARGRPPRAYDLAAAHFRLGMEFIRSDDRIALDEFASAIRTSPLYWRAWWEWMRLRLRVRGLPLGRSAR